MCGRIPLESCRSSTLRMVGGVGWFYVFLSIRTGYLYSAGEQSKASEYFDDAGGRMVLQFAVKTTTTRGGGEPRWRITSIDVFEVGEDESGALNVFCRKRANLDGMA